jgi:hypothetical protein
MVVVVLAPKGARYRVRTGRDRISGNELHVGFMTVEDREIGLQVLKPVVDSYFEQTKLCDANRIRLVDPVHIGKLSEIPQAYLAAEDLLPMIFLRDNMSDEYLNLRGAVRAITDGKGLN